MRIIVSVIARARTSSVEDLGDGMYKVRVPVPPEHGKANRAVCKILAAHFGVPVCNVRIIVGTTARKKMVDIDGINHVAA